MRHLLLFLSIATVILFTYLICMNFDSTVTLKYTTSAQEIKELAFVAYSIIVFLAGILTGAGALYVLFSVQKDKVNAYKRELERSSVSGMKNSSKVEVLEAKIKTLEKAFDTVIDERKQLELKISSLNAELESINKKNN